MTAPLDGDPLDAAAAAMNGNDTIVLQASPFAGAPRIKRLKTDHTPIHTESSFRPLQNGHTAISTPRSSESTPTFPTARQKSQTKSRSREATQTPKSPLTDARIEGPVLRKTKVPSLRLRLSQAPDLETQSLKITSAPRRRNIDFHAAPSEPSEFALWIAQQVRQASPTETAGNGRDLSLPGFDALTSVMRPLEAPPVDEDPAVVREKEREKQRLDNRERKKRWREINAERNKDNDLRCRVTKLAKYKYGDEDTQEKVAFIEHEFEQRRAKRAEKEKRNASYRGTLSAFRTGATSSKDLKEAIRASLKNVSKKSVEAAAMQLIEIVVDAAGQQLSENSLNMAQSLQRAMASGAADADSIEEAARILAGNEDLKRAFEEGPERNGSVDAENISLEDEEQAHFMNGQSTESATHINGKRGRASPTMTTGLTNAADDLNAAVRTLNGIGRPKRAKSSRRRAEKVYSSTRRKNKKPSRLNTKLSAKNRGVDTNSIDALLALANGGSIFDNNDDDDDDDEETLADSNELAVEDLSFSNTTTDEALDNVLERVATRVVRDRLEREPQHDRPESSAEGNAYQTHAVRELVLKMKAFVSEAGVGVNTLVPSTEAQALSELYAQLLKYIERERTPSEESATIFKPAAWSASGLIQPGQPTASDPLRPPSSHRSAEEHRKILTYGFPPLPGHTFVAR